MPLTFVRKRDGRLAAFDEKKIAAAIQKAQDAQGEDDPTFASEVAGVVRMTLEERFAGGPVEQPPDIEEIQDLVERALIELGRTQVAKAYILYRERRSQARAALEVKAPPSASVPAVQVQDAQTSHPWSKARIVAALVAEAELSRDTAERVATTVEARVWQSGLARISTGLVRELVDNELVNLGLDAALRRQVSFGLPVADLRRSFVAAPPTFDALAHGDAGREAQWSRSLAERVSGQVLRRFALAEVFSQRSLDRHLAGDLHLEGLDAPQRWLTLAAPLDLFRETQAVGSLHAESASIAPAFHALGALADLAASAAGHLVVELSVSDLETAFAQGRSPGHSPGRSPERTRRRGPGAGSSDLDSWLGAIEGLSRCGSARIDLALSGNAEPQVATALVCALARRTHPRASKLHLELALAARIAGEQDVGTLGLERLLEEGRVVVHWSAANQREQERPHFVSGGCWRFPKERGALALGGSAALNLPRLALRAGPWREERFLEALVELARDAAAGLAELARFQTRSAPARGAQLRPRLSYQIAPCGLREALQILGDGEIRPAQGARLLSVLADVIERQAGQTWSPASGSVKTVLGEWSSTDALRRFAELDADLPQHAQRLLFSDGAGHGLELGRAYSPGTLLSPAPAMEWFEAEARLLAGGPLCSFESMSLIGPWAAAAGRQARSACQALLRFEELLLQHGHKDYPSSGQPQQPRSTAVPGEQARPAALATLAEPKAPAVPLANPWNQGGALPLF